MDMNVYALECHARTKIDDARHVAARGALLGSLTTHGSSRARVGAVLIRVGRWMRGGTGRRRPVPVELARVVCAADRAR